LMTSHPYISGAGNIAQMIGFLRKNFPATVTSDTVKRLGIASNNESYVINALQFLGIVDEEGKRTSRGQQVLATHEDAAFKKAFEGLVKDAYKDLFELRGNDAWTMSKNELISYFRSVDKTSDVIGTRQAAVFHTLRGITGREPLAAEARRASKSATKTPKQKATKSERVKEPFRVSSTLPDPALAKTKKDMALTVRIEINLPAEASAETYDNIFKSIKANLLNE
jgi:hypothetical protein